ncbi:MAG: hypothetical protein CNA95_01975 [Pelagibacterales bacterium MED-G41]|nr:MAG: hypothetical protein CNA95_01975 [Pelagibacterales bacterium MED-G41]
MESFILQNKTARLAVLQRIELASPFLLKIRKLFGRYIFSNIITKYFLNPKLISQEYYKMMQEEFLIIKKFISSNDNFFLGIGSGIGGLELLINQNFKDKNYYFIERNYVSKKVKYGWGGMANNEAYNDLELQMNFLKINNMNESQINIYDYDKDDLPEIKFDIVISLFSLDYHYDFNIYIDYLKKVSKPETKLIFDTIRVDYFNKIFKNVKIISTNLDTVHKSNRIICSNFIN